MKTVAYTLYVVIVLLISGLARANAATLDSVQIQTQYQTPVQISQVTLDASKSELIVAGSLPNPCYGQPSVMLTQDSVQPNVLILRLSSPSPMNACVSRVKYFNAPIELPRLIQAAHLNLDVNVNYTLKVEGSEFELPLPGADLLKQIMPVSEAI